MILFYDTSALMKLYAQEQHSDWTRRQVTSSSHCAVSQITWVEMCAALALKARTRQIHAADARAAMERLKVEWPIYTRLTLDPALLNTAGEFAIQFGLRAYDSATGEVIWTFDTNPAFDTVNGIAANGGSMDGPGPVIANGLVYVTAGNGGPFGRPGNVLLVFGVD